MENRTTKISRLLKAYHAYLDSSDTAQFIAAIARNYTTATLIALLERSDILHSRAAALALGFVGDISCQENLGKMLSSSDRRLRLVSDDSLRAIMSRDGSDEQRLMLEKIIRLNECCLYEEALISSDLLLEKAPRFTEAYNQRALAWFHLHNYEKSIQDCRQVLQLSHHHYGAWIGLGHCLIEMGDVWGALDSFRKAVAIYPDLEPVRVQIRNLERSLQ